MKLVYDGPHDAVEVAAAPGLLAERGKAVEIPDVDVVVNVDDNGKPVTSKLAESLLEQGVWKKASTKAED